MTYTTYMIYTSIFLVLLSYLLWTQKRETTPKIENLIRFVCYGLVVLSVFSMIIGLSYATEYNNTPPCENLLNSSIIDSNNANITFNTYVSSCSGRAVFDNGNYFMVILIWSGFILGLLVMLGLIIMLGRMFNQW